MYTCCSVLSPRALTRHRGPNQESPETTLLPNPPHVLYLISAPSSSSTIVGISYKRAFFTCKISTVPDSSKSKYWYILQRKYWTIAQLRVWFLNNNQQMLFNYNGTMCVTVRNDVILRFRTHNFFLWKSRNIIYLQWLNVCNSEWWRHPKRLALFNSF